MNDEQRERVLRQVVRLAPQPADRVDASTQLEDELGFDSLTLVELALALEQEFQLPPLSEGDAIEIATVGDVQSLVASALANREA